MSKEKKVENIDNFEQKEQQVLDKNIEPPQKENNNPLKIYTPLNQDAKPYISKRMQKMNFQNSNEQINNIVNNNEYKRNNYLKKNDIAPSPIYSYFNSSRKYFNEEYKKNIKYNKTNEVIESNKPEENSEEGSGEDEEEEVDNNEDMVNNTQNHNQYNNQFNDINQRNINYNIGNIKYNDLNQNLPIQNFNIKEPYCS